MSAVAFLILVMAVVDFTRAFFTQETLAHAAAEGARAAAVRQCRDTATVPPTVTTSIDYAIYRALFLIEGSLASVGVTYDNGSATVGRQVTVSISYNFSAVTPLVEPIILGTLGSAPQLAGSATSTVEQILATC